MAWWSILGEICTGGVVSYQAHGEFPGLARTQFDTGDSASDPSLSIRRSTLVLASLQGVDLWQLTVTVNDPYL